MFDAIAPLDPENLPDGFAEAIGLDADRRSDIECYRRRLIEANAKMNLIGAATADDFGRRHVLDSAQLVWFAPAVRRWADIGSGAGLPGIILAILLKGRSGARVHLIESIAKRAKFLVETVEALDLPASVHHARAESVRLEVEAVTARACAPLGRLFEFVHPFMRRGARAILLKGQGVEAEIAQARAQWQFCYECRQSLSDPSGRVLFLKELAHARKA